MTVSNKVEQIHPHNNLTNNESDSAPTARVISFIVKPNSSVKKNNKNGGSLSKKSITEKFTFIF
jgi:hypothetical protein